MESIIINGKVHIVFSNGNSVSTEYTPEVASLLAEDDEDKIKRILAPEFLDYKKALDSSSILISRGASVYMKGVSEVSIPSDFVQTILDAETSGNTSELKKWKNFWTLVSMNPDARVRNNIFWFIRRWNMKISNSGFIIAYRNVCLKEEARFSTSEIRDIINDYYTEKYVKYNNPEVIASNVEGYDNLKELYNAVTSGADFTPTYTDDHTHTFVIKIGQPVSMPRKDCDSVQENSCSRGLHVGATEWLRHNYCGEIGLQVLVNPADIVAVPTIDDYGKVRTCRYLPVATIAFDDTGHVIEPEISISDDIEYIKKFKIEGDVNNEDFNNYTVSLSSGQTKEEIFSSILYSLEHPNDGLEEELKDDEDYDDGYEE